MLETPPLLSQYFQSQGGGRGGWSQKTGSRMQRNNRVHLKARRKQLRNDPTPAEKLLWLYLKLSQLDGHKFRRQHSYGSYIMDFYCPSERLCVEVDGESHSTPEAQAHDRQRIHSCKPITSRYSVSPMSRPIKVWKKSLRGSDRNGAPTRGGIRSNENDTQIGELVCELYGLTEDEIRIVEGEG